MLSRRETSIALQTDKTPAEYVALAQLIDEFAFDVVSVYNDLPYHPAFGPLFLMAPHLHRARIGPAGVSPTRMAPIDMAANVALLHACAPAGAYLGIVRGAWGERFGIPPLRAPLRDMRDCARIVQQLLHGEAIHPPSHAFPVPTDARLALPLPETEIPLLIGTWGSRLAHIACAFANEVKIGGSANPRLAARMACILRAGESEHNRAPGEVRLVLGCVTVVAEDRAAAREKARRAAARYLTVVLPLDPTISPEPALLARLEDCLARADDDSAASLISDEMLDAFVLAGRPSDIIARCEELYEAGVDRIEFGTPHGLSSAAGISLLGKRVLPSLK